ncbi:MAG: helix-turn-helix transcriptional regulator [Desulfobaccales bacterium]
MKKIAERLQYAREVVKALTQQQVAELTHQALRTVQNHESGLHKPPDKVLRVYAALYGCSYRWLLTGEEDSGELDLGRVPLAADDAGLWGRTRQEEGDGVPHTVTVFEPKTGRKGAPALGHDVDMLQSILASHDSLFIQAAQREKAYQARIAELERQVEKLRKALKPTPDPDTPGSGET